MKNSIILQILSGMRGREAMQLPKDERGEAFDIGSAREQLKAALSPQLWSLHQQLIESLDEVWSNEVDFFFVEGFKIGLQVGIEAAK